MRHVALFSVLALAGCGSLGAIKLDVTVKPTCLPMAPYTLASEQAAAAERAKLADDNVLNIYLTDYGRLRAANRAVCPATTTKGTTP